MSRMMVKLKLLLYVTSVAVIVTGGMILLNVPYNYRWHFLGAGREVSFTVVDEPGHYPQLEVTTFVRNAAEPPLLDMLILNIDTLDSLVLNITMTESDRLSSSSFNRVTVLDLYPGEYLIRIDRLVGSDSLDLGLRQLTDSDGMAPLGAWLNVLGLFVAVLGFCLPVRYTPPTDNSTPE